MDLPAPKPAKTTGSFPLFVTSNILLSHRVGNVKTLYNPVEYDEANPDQIKVRIVVDMEGRVISVEPASSNLPDVDAIRRDIMSWRFTPLRAGGQIFPMTGTLAVQQSKQNRQE